MNPLYKTLILTGLLACPQAWAQDSTLPAASPEQAVAALPTSESAAPIGSIATPVISPMTIAGAPAGISEPKLVLALDRILPRATEDKVKRLLKEETLAVVKLHLGGQIRQWYFRQDRPGAVFVLEVNDLDQAQKLLDNLPLSKAGLVAYDLIPIGPYIPLATLLNGSNGNGRKLP